MASPIAMPSPSLTLLNLGLTLFFLPMVLGLNCVHVYGDVLVGVDVDLTLSPTGDVLKTLVRGENLSEIAGVCIACLENVEQVFGRKVPSDCEQFLHQNGAHSRFLRYRSGKGIGDLRVKSVVARYSEGTYVVNISARAYVNERSLYQRKSDHLSCKIAIDHSGRLIDLRNNVMINDRVLDLNDIGVLD